MALDRTLLLIVIRAIGEPQGDTLESRLTFAMKAARANGIVCDENAQFYAAAEAVRLQAEKEGDDYTCERLRQEIELLRNLPAALVGVRVVDIGGKPKRTKRIGLLRLWQETATP